MRANLIYHDNGVGLAADAEIVARRLHALGVDVDRSECADRVAPRARPDINIHLELFDPWWMDHAAATYLIPNQEWLNVNDLPSLGALDGILCKSRFAQAALRVYCRQTEYIGFTSRDRYRPAVAKDPRKWLHLVGRSGQKGTDAVIEAWRANPDFPMLTVLYDPTNDVGQRAADCGAVNIAGLGEHVSDDTLAEIMNSHEVHVCPSEIEGFGHSLNEALACKAVVVTTGAPPMNELVTAGTGVLVPWSTINEDPAYPLITRRFGVSAQRLVAAVRTVMALPRSARAQMGERGRTEYLARDRRFAKAFDAFFVERHWGVVAD